MKYYLFSLLFAVTLWSGCQSTAQRKVYNSLAVIGHSESAAMQAAAKLEVQKKLSPEAWPKIAEAHDRFIPAYSVAVAAARMDYNQLAPANVVNLANEVIHLVELYSK